MHYLITNNEENFGMEFVSTASPNVFHDTDFHESWILVAGQLQQDSAVTLVNLTKLLDGRIPKGKGFEFRATMQKENTVLISWKNLQKGAIFSGIIMFIHT